MTARVFFISRSMRFNVESAKTFGEPKFVFEEMPNVFVLDKLVQQIATALELADFNENTDFVAMTGPTAALVTLFSVVIGEYGKARALIFDARSDTYRERILKVPA